MLTIHVKQRFNNKAGKYQASVICEGIEENDG